MLATKIADAKAAARRGDGPPSLCCGTFCLKPLAPSEALVRRCRENGWPLPRRCWAHRRARAGDGGSQEYVALCNYPPCPLHVGKTGVLQT